MMRTYLLALGLFLFSLGHVSAKAPCDCCGAACACEDCACPDCSTCTCCC